MKNINSLVQDIYTLISNPKTFARESINAFSEALALKLTNRLSEERGEPTLRASNLGKPCGRQLWFDIHRSSEREALPPAARLKFLFGDILEELLLFLAREAGHTVTSEQVEVDIAGVKGHIDAVVDGRLVDCKSASSYSFEKFQSHSLPNDDPFGYITQLGAYLAGVKDRPEVVDKDVASFLVVDKTLGHLCLDTYPDTGKDYTKLVEEKREMLAQSEPPPRPYADVPFQKGGNKKLATVCSYCPFKQLCWKDANEGKGLRTFIYSNGPVFLTEVKKLPNVPEAQ